MIHSILNPLPHSLIVAILTIGTNTASAITSFSDIDYWVGSGANEAALIVDFNDGASTEAWAWGYRWTGSASGAEMIDAIASADPNFTILFSGTVSAGFFLGTITYDGSAGLQTETNDFTPGVDENWGYYLAPDTTAADANNWVASGSGASDRMLSDGAWDAWSFGNYDPNTFAHLAPPDTGQAAAAPVPEPGSFAIVFSLVAAMFAARRRR